MTEDSSEADRKDASLDAALTDRRVTLTRSFDAPRELVFHAWTDPEHVSKWWGPHGFTIPVCELDVRPGGEIRIHMQGPDGTVYPMLGEYLEILEPERLVFKTTALDAEGAHLFEGLNVVTFAEENGRTTMTVEARVTRSTPEAAPYLEGMEIGWTQQMERLSQYVERL